MGDLYTDEPGERLLSDLRNLFQTKTIFQKREKHIVFVCGGPTNTRKTMRRRFLDWSKTNFPAIITILAEDAFKPTEFYDPPTSIDLDRFESIMATIADCIVVFPESAGSYAEVGYFSDKHVSKKMLIANSLDHQVSDSFLNLGPIRRIDRTSLLKPAIQLSPACLDFSPLRTRLRRITLGSRRRRFTYKPYWEMDYREKFLATLQLISILQPIDLEGLNVCFKAIFQATKPQDIGHMVAILHAAGYVTSRDDFFKMPPGAQPLLEVRGIEMGKIRSRVLLYYTKKRTEVTGVLRGQQRG